MPRIVLYEPQIPPNTGNVARTCAATGTPLHLIEPLGFTINDRTLKRAGLDYWPWVDLHRHRDWQSFRADQRSRGGRLLALTRHARQPYPRIPYRARCGGRLIALSSHATSAYDSCSFRDNDWLLFGRETDGLPKGVSQSCDMSLVIPMRHEPGDQGQRVRSLNLSVSVAVVLFEALRQLRLTEV